MRLDMTITLGNVVQIAVFVGGLLLAYTALRERLVRIETQTDALWGEFLERRKTPRHAEDRS